MLPKPISSAIYILAGFLASLGFTHPNKCWILDQTCETMALSYIYQERSCKAFPIVSHVGLGCKQKCKGHVIEDCVGLE